MPIDYENDIILLTCANGKQCHQLIPFLLPKWKHLRLAVTSDSSRQQLLDKYANKSEAHIEVVLGDLAQINDCKRMMEGVAAVFHVAPPLHPKETEIGCNMIEAAQANNNSMKHFILSSVLHPSLRKLLHHDGKRYVEEALIESGLPYTILQPSTFMDNFPVQKILSEENPVFPALFDPNVPFTTTALYDLAEATSKILDQRERHFYATYQMVSTAQPMTYAQVCKVVSGVIGKDIRVEEVPFEKMLVRDPPMEKRLGLPVNAATRDTAQRMLLYYKYRGLLGSPNVMRWVLGREPLGWEGWVNLKMKESGVE